MTDAEKEKELPVTWLHAEHLSAEADTLEKIASQLAEQGELVLSIKLRGSARRLRNTADGIRYLL